ncbi:glycosyltransferase [Candidatus Microgenomates bacterium]|nr:glycosyltransferase [Candidatus Microgenomates bacterium]
MKIISKPTVTVAVSCFNEGENILPFLESVLKQKETGYVLEKILVYSDGSTDDTVKKAKSLNNSKIKIFAYKKRIGKSSHLNDIYQNLKSDILVQSDADVIFSYPYLITDLIKPFKENKSVGMTGGRTLPLPAVTFTEKAVGCSYRVYDQMRALIGKEHNVYTAIGQILAFKKELVKKINVPSNMTSNDSFTYFSCLTYGYKYRYVSQALVYFRSPRALRDHIRQGTRIAITSYRMFEYFKKELVEKEFALPRGLLITLMFKEFLRHPVLCSYIFLVNFYCKLKAKSPSQYSTAKWAIALTTKKLDLKI